MKRINRVWWQITGLTLLNFPFIERLSFSWLPVCALNCYSCPIAQGACPIGTIQHFLVIGAIPLLALGFVGLWGIIAGRFWCGNVCPFGFFQDLLGKLRRRKIRIPHALEYGKYLSLVLLVVILPPILKEPFFCTLCPAGTLEAGIPIVSQAWYEAKFASADVLFSPNFGIIAMVGWWFWMKIGILVAYIAASVVIRRPFCRTTCPLGALFGLFNRISILVHPKTGTEPGKKPRYNLKNCPVHITHPDQVDSSSCIKCRECYPTPYSPPKSPTIQSDTADQR